MNLRAHKRYVNLRTERHPRAHPPGASFIRLHRVAMRFWRMPGEVGRVERFTFIVAPLVATDLQGSAA